jgi:hypothetical protein
MEREATVVMVALGAATLLPGAVVAVGQEVTAVMAVTVVVNIAPGGRLTVQEAEVAEAAAVQQPMVLATLGGLVGEWGYKVKVPMALEVQVVTAVLLGDLRKAVEMGVLLRMELGVQAQAVMVPPSAVITQEHQTGEVLEASESFGPELPVNFHQQIRGINKWNFLSELKTANPLSIQFLATTSAKHFLM